MIENQNFTDAEQYFKEKYLNKSYSLDRLREALGLPMLTFLSKNYFYILLVLFQKLKTKMKY